MDEQWRKYTIGYGKPPAESRFQKGRSGNPGGRRRGTKPLITLMTEALSRRSGFPNPDGSWMTQAEVIFAGLVAQAAGADLKAKRLLFDVLIKLQGANIGWPRDRLPEIQLDDSDDARAVVAADIERLAAAMTPHGSMAPDEMGERQQPAGTSSPAISSDPGAVAAMPPPGPPPPAGEG